MSIVSEIVKVCTRYVSGEIHVKAFESAFDSLVIRHEEELQSQARTYSHIEAIRQAMDAFEPVAAARNADPALIDENELRRRVKEHALHMKSSAPLLPYDEALTVHLNDKCTRRVLVYGEELMLVEYTFQKGGVGTLHKHEEHDQVGYVVKGSFELTLGEEKRIVRAGDSYYAVKNVPHGVVALEDDSVAIDAFTPKRTDFLA